MPHQSHQTKIVLASSSSYRKLLLEQLGIPFETFAPDVDETPRQGEQPAELVNRLAREKGLIVADQFPDALVIGSDQLAVCNGTVVGKPGTPENAILQLSRFSGRTVDFQTAVAVMCSGSGYLFERTVITQVQFRVLEEEEIHRYVQADKPLDCAGSFKSEALGISLLDSMTSPDPTAIVGLPLIAVSKGLRNAGFNLP
jgi:septum formation protein